VTFPKRGRLHNTHLRPGHSGLPEVRAVRLIGLSIGLVDTGSGPLAEVRLHQFPQSPPERCQDQRGQVRALAVPFVVPGHS
jgi:hypothetical protein